MRYLSAMGVGGGDNLAKQCTGETYICKTFISEHAPPEENYGPGHRVARFSKVAKEANNVEVGI